MVNHGGSPPNLGLKESTPKLGETRLNRDAFKQPHNNKKQHEYNIFAIHLQFPTKVCTMIHKWNHKHWVKVGSPKRRMPYPYALTILQLQYAQQGFQEHMPSKAINIHMPQQGFQKTYAIQGYQYSHASTKLSILALFTYLHLYLP